MGKALCHQRKEGLFVLILLYLFQFLSHTLLLCTLSRKFDPRAFLFTFLVVSLLPLYAKFRDRLKSCLLQDLCNYRCVRLCVYSSVKTSARRDFLCSELSAGDRESMSPSPPALVRLLGRMRTCCPLWNTSVRMLGSWSHFPAFDFADRGPWQFSHVVSDGDSFYAAPPSLLFVTPLPGAVTSRPSFSPNSTLFDLFGGIQT